MAQVVFPAFLAIAGLIVYALATEKNTKVAELARIAYACGLLVLTFVLAHELVKVLP